jgi:hypothetical protein
MAPDAAAPYLSRMSEPKFGEPLRDRRGVIPPPVPPVPPIEERLVVPWSRAFQALRASLDAGADARVVADDRDPHDLRIEAPGVTIRLQVP